MATESFSNDGKVNLVVTVWCRRVGARPWCRNTFNVRHESGAIRGQTMGHAGICHSFAGSH